GERVELRLKVDGGDRVTIAQQSERAVPGRAQRPTVAVHRLVRLPVVEHRQGLVAGLLLVPAWYAPHVPHHEPSSGQRVRLDHDDVDAVEAPQRPWIPDEYAPRGQQPA